VKSTDRVALARVYAVVLTILSFFPFANWIAGGHEAQWFADALTEWASGTAISIGSALVIFLAMRRYDWWPSGWERVAEIADRRSIISTAALGAGALALFAVVARTVLPGRPLQIDEIVQVMQARIFAEGRLARAADPYPEFFSALNVVDMNGSLFSQFPPGGPLMFLPGVLAGAIWLTGPVLGAVAVVAYWRLVRATEAPSVALGAASLLAIAPFTVFMAGSHMNHVPTLAWLCLALLSLHAVTSSKTPRPLAALATGFCLGMMISIRPLDGAAFALPAGLWLLTRTVQKLELLPSLILSGVGIAVPVAGVLAFNAATTGDPFLFGYELLWGASHNLGFHRPPWGVAHTPARGLELVNLYFLRLQTYLFETPLPSLVPAIGALALVRRLTSFDRYLLVSAGLLVASYFAYWHDGIFLGPRFFYPLLPVLVLWTARLPAIARERFPTLGVDRAVLITYAVSAAVAVFFSVPVRMRQYQSGMLLARLDYLAPATGLDGALILVRESWGAQVIARLYALGVSRSEAEGLYRTIDTCALEGAVAALEADSIRGTAAMERLRPLAKDSLRLLSSTLSPDGTQRMLPGSNYSPLCQRRILEDRAGYAFFAPLLAGDAGTNIYARDLHARDTLLLARYPERPVYLLRGASSEAGARLLLEPLKLDSARSEWASSASIR
jgi:hypothetical protein